MDAIQSAYSLFESLNLSVTSLVVIALIFALAFLFSFREAAAWFFKIDDIKKELRHLNETAYRLEGEISSLQSLLTEARQEEPRLVAVSTEAQKEERAPQAPPSSSSSSFPVVH